MDYINYKKPYYGWLWNPLFTNKYYENSSYLFNTGWLTDDYIKKETTRYPIYNVNGYIFSVAPYPYGPSGQSDPDTIFDHIVSFSFDPPIGRWIGSGWDSFYFTQSDSPVDLIASDHQRPWEFQSTKTITNQYNKIEQWEVTPTTETEIIPSENVLLVYNESCPASVDLKDYYTGARTGLKGLNILGINCDSGQFAEVTHTGNYVRNIRDPIWNYIRTTDKPIKYCILMYGIPISMTGDQSGVGSGKIWTDYYTNELTPEGPGAYETLGRGITGQIAYDLSHTFYHASGYCRHPNYEAPAILRGSDGHNYNSSYEYFSGVYFAPNIRSTVSPYDYIFRPLHFAKDFTTTFLVTHLFADSPADVSGYIHKITGQGIVDGIYLKGNGLNTGALLSSASRTYPDLAFLQTAQTLSGIYSGLNKDIIHQDRTDWFARTFGPSPTTCWLTGHNVNAWMSYGIHTDDESAGPYGQIQYPQYNVKFEGNNNWFFTLHIESYGAQNRAPSYGGSTNKSYWFSPPYKQFASNAYGGSNYSNIPVAWFAHNQEPGWIAHGGNGSQINGKLIAQFWTSGVPWIECVYSTMVNSVPYQLWGGISIGDPFLKCF